MNTAPLLLLLAALAAPRPGDRLVYLDETAPFYVHADFPKLTTPMWFGEDGVDAVVLLSIDDLNEGRMEHYRQYLEPILVRLEKVEGYAPLTIFANTVDPANPQLGRWLERGVLCDVHTRSHPCPLMGRGVDGGTAEVLDCLENLNRIEGHRAVGFRMPCCDSINSTTPLFFTEIFSKRAADGSFLEVDSSVPVLLDPAHRVYAPFRNYAITVEGYPYPFVIARLAWELPIVVPTDWQAQNLRGVNHADTVADIKSVIDGVVAARGLYTLCFHPHGWIRNSQVVDIIDHVVEKHGRRVRFQTVREVLERINRHLLGGASLRASDGSDNGVRLLDVDNDGFLDVVIANDERRVTRLWRPRAGRWDEVEFPFALVTRRDDGQSVPTGVRFGVLRADGRASALLLGDGRRALAHFADGRWTLARPQALQSLATDPEPVASVRDGRDRGVRLRDVDGDGRSDLIVNNDSQNAVFRWSPQSERFERTSATLPRPASIVDASGADRGLRFWDVDRDGHPDAVLSNDDEYFVYLFDARTGAWSRRVLHGPAGGTGAMPKFVSGGRDRGAWHRDGVLYVANDATTTMDDLVDIRRFDFMIEHMQTPPLEPDEALETFRLPPGFRIELAAAEPLVRDPVSIEFGADGRVWVAEMGDYPSGEGADAGGRIRVLRDADGDGRLEESTVFARDLRFPAGVLPHGDGALVTAAPDILYLEDTDGDGVADERRVVFTGFGEGNHQHRVNGLHRGIDNWIYGANGDSGGTIRSALDENHPAVSIGGRDFRIRRDLGLFESVSGRTQFGLTFDDFGNRFGSSNSRHLMHAVLPQDALARNPHHAPPDPVLDIPDHGAMGRIFQVSRHLLSLNTIHVPGHFSSACGVSIYRGARFPEAYRGSAFVAEPVGNIVHRDVLVPDGATFRAVRGEPDSEFLASTDSWFRPVFTASGPDGALWVADMYRWVIEHPQYIPVEIQQILDLGAGRDRGRIYRVVWEGDGASPRSPAWSDMSRLGVAELVHALEDADGRTRDTAQWLLVERGDRSIAPELRRIARSSDRPASRVHALWTLDALGALETDTIREALGDGDARVREHAVKLAGSRGRAGEKALVDAVIARARDDALRVRLEAAIVLGDVDSAAASAALADVLRRDGGDRWVRAAVMSAPPVHAPRLLDALFADASEPIEGDVRRAVLEPLVGTTVRAGGGKSVSALLERLAARPAVDRGHVALLAALVSAGGLEAPAASALSGRARGALERIRSHARGIALDATRPDDERIEAITALGPALLADRDATEGLLSHRQSPALQTTAVRVVASAARDSDAAAGVSRALLGAWRRVGPVARGEIVEALLSRKPTAASLADALESGAVDPVELDARARKRLLDDDALRERVAPLLERETPAPRREVIERYLETVRGTSGDREAGKRVFAEHCGSCHRLDDVGHHVGPDLASMRSRDPALLLQAILDPGGMVPPRYQLYTAILRNGRVATGLIASETPTAVTLARAGGVTETILRTEIRTLSANLGSLMPAELERAITPKAMADLLAFLAGK